MKKLLIIAFISLFCVSCSNYPTSGGIDMELLKKRIDGDIVIDQSFGIVVELDEDIVEDFKQIRLHELDLKEVYNNFDHQPNLDINYPKVDEIKQALSTYRSWDDQIVDNAHQAIHTWKANAKPIHEVVIQRHDELKSSLSEYLELIKPAQAKWDEKNAEKAELNKQYDQILKNIVSETNRQLVVEKLPYSKIRESRYRLSYKELSWKKLADVSHIDCNDPNKGVNRRYLGAHSQNYSKEFYVIVDHLKASKTCYYISRPIRGMGDDEYDTFVQNQFNQYLKLDAQIKENEQNLKKAKKALNDAHTIAKNQININYEKIHKEISSLEYLINDLGWALSDDLSVEKYLVNNKVDMNTANRLNQTQRSLRTYLKNQKQQASLESIGEFYDAIKNSTKNIWQLQSDSKQNYDFAVNRYIQAMSEYFIEEHTVDVNEFDDDCTFDGLDGSSAYVIVVANCRINGKKKAFRHYFDMTPEKHGYQDKDGLWVNYKKFSLNHKDTTPESLNALLVYPVKKVLDEHLDQVDDEFNKQLNQREE